MGSSSKTAMLFFMNVMLALGGCAADPYADYDRHRMSSMSVLDEAAGTLLFEAQVSPKYPLDNEAAEAVRRRWIGAWLERRTLCPGGFEIIERRRYQPLDDNPHHAELRYELRCQDSIE